MYPQNPEEWRDFLVRQHIKNLQRRVILAAYYDGDFGNPRVNTRFEQAYHDIWNEARSNWGRLVVDVAVDRLSVEGVRLDTDDADELAWSLWQRSSLDAVQGQVYVDALVFGLGAVLVWPDESNEPVATPESAMEVTFAMAPGTSGIPLAAIKMWVDDVAEMVRADVYMRDGVYRWVIPNKKEMPKGNEAAGLWIEWPDGHLDNPFVTDLPMVPFENRLRLGVIQGDLDDLIPTIDRLTRLQADMMLVSSCLGFPQRWATGIEIPRDPNGNPIAPFQAAIDRLWMSEGEKTNFGSFAQADMSGILKAIDATIGELSARSRTPAHLLMTSDLVNPPSAAALQVMESGLVSRVKSKQRFFGESWERVVRLMLKAISDPRADLFTMEMIWADPETHSDAVRADALSKLYAFGTPTEMLWELWGFSPQQIQRMKDQAMEQAILEAMRQPALGETGTPPSPPVEPVAA